MEKISETDPFNHYVDLVKPGDMIIFKSFLFHTAQWITREGKTFSGLSQSEIAAMGEHESSRYSVVRYPAGESDPPMVVKPWKDEA